jgi:Transglycosylase SLT domain
MLSALAGGGLTAASLSGQLSSTALAAGPSGGPVTGEGATPPVSTTPTTTIETAPSQPSTTTTTVVAPPPTPGSKRSSTTTTGPQPSTPPPVAPKVVLRQKQKSTGAGKANEKITPTSGKLKEGSKSGAASGPSNVALSPQLVASQAGALAAALASSAASVQALGFYRIPPFLLPIYKAAAAQYGVPWQILAAINEIETNYGSDQSVSTAGAVGWMQFMPATWLQYGVDALNAGYADPYNPVDAIFAAARYLRAAGASTDLHAAILAYNHSEEYASSVLLRAKLISTYPRSVVASLTGLIDGRLPVTGKQVAWGPLLPTRSSATANATAAPTSAATSEAPAKPTAKAAAVPGSSPAPSPASAVARAGKKGAKGEPPLQLVDLMSAPNANVVAVQDGRIMQVGDTRELGKYVVLRDVYGDLFTYAGLGSIAPTYTPPHAASAAVETPAATIAGTHDRAPSQAATAGRQPLTLQVKAPARARPASKADHAVVSADPGEAAPAGMGKVRLFAHPGNPDAIAAAASASGARSNAGHRPLNLRRGAIVASGTVLGRVRTPAGAVHGHLRFAVRPAGDAATIDPRPVLASWAQLAAAVHPQGAKAARPLVGATTSDVFLLSNDQLASDVLSDPGITIDACGRGDIASGAVDRRVLAMLAFLSRSGLQPTVSGVRCTAAHASEAGAASRSPGMHALDIAAINGTPIAGHQGPGTVTDLAIRTLLSLPAGYQPERVVSLMRYPGAANTHATPQAWSHIHVEFRAASPTVALGASTPGAVARSATAARAAASQLVGVGGLTPAEWDQLITRIASLPAPTVAVKPSSSAIPDPKHP